MKLSELFQKQIYRKDTSSHVSTTYQSLKLHLYIKVLESSVCLPPLAKQSYSLFVIQNVTALDLVYSLLMKNKALLKS